MAVLAAALAAGAIAIAVPALKRVAGLTHTPSAPAAAPRHPHAASSAAHHRGQPSILHAAARDVVAVLEKLVVLLGLLAGAGTVIVILVAARRLYTRHRRVYHAYQIQLTANDQTELQTMVQAVGTIGQAVAGMPTGRWRHEQPAFGLLVGHDPRSPGETTLALVCAPEHVRALDGALLRAYPNARVGFDFGSMDRPLDMHRVRRPSPLH